MDRVDIKIDINGEIVLNSAGDFDFVSNDDAVIQTVMFRLKTTLGDWILSPNIGTTLEEYIGLRNSDENLSKINSVVTNELNKIVQMPTFQVYTAPQGDNGVWIMVEFQSTQIPGTNHTLFFDFDLKTGVIQPRDTQ